MQTLLRAAPALALVAALSSVLLALSFATADGALGPRPDDHGPVAPVRNPPEVPERKALSASIPARDVRGESIPSLPRYPGSVRVAYSEKRADNLRVVRAGYLAEKPPGAIRDFYRGVFHSGPWRLANVEYAGNEWYFLAVDGGREAVVEVSSRVEGSKVGVEVSEPWGRPQEVPALTGGSKR